MRSTLQDFFVYFKMNCMMELLLRKCGLWNMIEEREDEVREYTVRVGRCVVRFQSSKTNISNIEHGV